MTMQSRRVTFGPTGAALPYPQPAQLVTSYDVDDSPARPLALHVDVYDRAFEADPGAFSWTDESVEPPVEYTSRTVPRRGAELLASPTLAAIGGQLLLTYGAGAAVRRLVCDLKSGTYQLPPCESARVEALVFSQGPWTRELIVGGALVEGWVPQPARFTYTYQVALRPSAEIVLPYPDGARWVQAFAPAALAGAASLPSVALATPYQVLDYGAGVYTNAGPVELVPGAGGLTLQNRADPTDAVVRFYLEV